MTVWELLRVFERLGNTVIPPGSAAAVEALADAGLVERRAVDAVRVWYAGQGPARPFLRPGQPPVSGFRRRSVSTLAGSIGRHDRFSRASLVGLAAAYQESVGTIAELLRSQTPGYGFEVPEVPEAVAGLKPDVPVREALCDGGRWARFISLSDLVAFADNHGLDLPTAAAELNAYAPLGAPTVPVRPGSARPSEYLERDTAAEYALLQSCLEDSWTLPPLGLVVAAGRLGAGLRETYRRLGPFTEVGLELPYPEPGCDRVPDWRDVVLLTTRLTGREPVLSQEVGADHLDLAAEETGLTVDEVRARLADYAPLFGFRPPPHERI
jgi:hypothetical protein